MQRRDDQRQARRPVREVQEALRQATAGDGAAGPSGAAIPYLTPEAFGVTGQAMTAAQIRSWRVLPGRV